MSKIKSILEDIEEMMKVQKADHFKNCIKNKLQESLEIYYKDITRKIDKAYEYFESNGDIKNLKNINSTLTRRTND